MITTPDQHIQSPSSIRDLRALVKKREAKGGRDKNHEEAIKNNIFTAAEKQRAASARHRPGAVYQRSLSSPKGPFVGPSKNKLTSISRRALLYERTSARERFLALRRGAIFVQGWNDNLRVGIFERFVDFETRRKTRSRVNRNKRKSECILHVFTARYQRKKDWTPCNWYVRACYSEITPIVINTVSFLY